MYRMIIADDEKIIRESLKNLVRWEELGFEVTAVFEDGDEVIEYLEYMPVDVILTDIYMPGKTGIDIAQYVYESKLACCVVFLSGYREFELAVQAVKYNVKDYILKPSKIEEVRKLFQKLKEELDLREQKKENQKRWLEAKSILKERFVNDLVMGAIGKTEFIRQSMNLLYPDINADLCPCTLMTLDIENYQEFIRDIWNYTLEQFDEAVNHFVEIADKEAYFHVVYKKGCRIKLFAISKAYGESEDENIFLCEKLTNSFVEEFMDVFDVNVITKTEAVFRNIYQINDRNVTAGKKDHSEYVIMEVHHQEQKKLIMTNIMQGNINVARNIMHNMLDHLQQMDLHYREQFLIGVFSMISEFLQENNPVLFREIQPFINYRLILNMKTEEEMLRYCDCLFNKMREKEKGNNFEVDGIVNRVKVYIDENIFSDISLADIADQMFLSTAHLSRLFKKQTGENFLQYVTRKKMDKAAELLHDPQYRVYQVGECLGYKSSRYFSKLFYNYFGYYPGEYRKQVLNIGGLNVEE